MATKRRPHRVSACRHPCAPVEGRPRAWAVVLLPLVGAGSVALSTTAAAEPGPSLLGAWQLVRVHVVDGMNSNPMGTPNFKFQFDADGRFCIAAPNQAFDPQQPCGRYTAEGTVLDIRAPARPSKTSGPSGTFLLRPDGSLEIRQPGGNVWTARRLSGPAPLDQLLEPGPVDEPSAGDGVAIVPVALRPDEAILPPAQRLIGTWEEIGRCEVRSVSLPPWGYLNEVWTFTASHFERTERRGRESTRSGQHPYALADNGFQLQPNVRLAVSFNAWGHLVLTRDYDRERVFLKRLRHQPDPSLLPKLKIVWSTGDRESVCPFD